MMQPTLHPYQYVVLRCVPRADREEFINVGVVLHCPERAFLGVRWHLDEGRLSAFAPDLDLGSLRAALMGIEAMCSGVADAGFGNAVRATAYGTREVNEGQGTRFGFLKAPRSTVLQPGPVHGGLTDDPQQTLERLLVDLVA